MALGVWHSAAQRRLNALFTELGLNFYDFHYGAQNKTWNLANKLKHYPDFVVLFDDGKGGEVQVAIELKTTIRLMDNRNGIQFRYFVKRFDGFILITDQYEYEPLHVWISLEGLNTKIRWIYETQILSEVASYAKNDSAFRWFYDRYAQG